MNKSVYAKILAAQQAVAKVVKTGKNNQQGYKYATEVDMLDAARPALLDAGLAVFASVESSDVQTLPIDVTRGTDTKTVLYSTAKVVMKYTVADIETGETVEAFSHGYAHDTGDKAIYKATTGASKYFFFKFLGIGTTDDPETGNGEIEKPTPKKVENKPTPVPAPKPVQTEPTPEQKAVIAIMDNLEAYSLTPEQFTAITGMKSLKGQTVEALNAALAVLMEYIDSKGAA